MRHKFKGNFYRAGLVSLLCLSLLLVACGDASPAANSATSPAPTSVAATTAPATSPTAPLSEATATPVVLPTSQARPTTALAAVSTLANPTSNSTTPVRTGAAAASTSASTARASVSAVAATSNPTTPVRTGTTAVGTSSAVTAVAAPTKTPQLTALTGYPGKLSILGGDSYVYVSRFDGKPPQLLLGQAGVTVSATQDGEVFRFPTWSRDGSKLAAMGVNIKAGQADTVNVYVAAADGSGSYKVQDSAAVSPVYISWSPDGNFLTLLMGVTGVGGLELRLADISKGAAGAKAVGLRKVSQGNPVYTSWSADSDNLLIHSRANSTDSLALVKAKDSTSSPQALKLSGSPGAYRAPSWSADGKLLAFSTAQASQNGESLVVQGKDGMVLGAAELNGPGAVFNWSLTGTKLAYSFQSGQDGIYEGINLSDLAGADAPKNGKISTTKIVDSPVLAFFWSPDGKKLAYLNLNADESRAVWNVYDLDSKKSTKLAEWFPTNNLIQVINYFDQYSQSDSIWSPDSKAIVFTGWVNSTVSADGKAEGPALVYVMPTEGQKVGQTQAIGVGSLAFWAK